jgi:hypothetical protein
MVYIADQCFLGNASQDVRLRSGISVDYGHLIMKSAGSRVSLKVENALMYGKEMYQRYRLGRQNDLWT